MLSSAGRYVRRHHLGLIAIFIALGGGAYAATQPGPDGDIDACFKKKSGQLYVQKKAKCKKGTKAISWAQVGPQGEQGLRGPAGAPGTARAWGRVGSDGTLTSASDNVSVTRESTGVFCIAAAGVPAAGNSLVASVDYNDAALAFGTTQFRDTDDANPDPIGPSGNTVPFVAWDSIPNVCAAGQFEVRTFKQQVKPLENQIDTSQSNNAFSFVIP